MAVCEVNARVATGYDLFVPTDADGNALGAAGGLAWFLIAMAFGGGFRTVEARVKAPWEARVLSGLGWHVTSRLELTLITLAATLFRIRATAGFADLLNRRFCGYGP